MEKSFSTDFSKISILPYASYLVALLAVTFDLGYFSAIDINLFTAFSLSEHLLFSIEAIPPAILIVVGFMLIYQMVKSHVEHFAFTINSPSLWRLRLIEYAQVVVIQGALFIVAFLHKGIDRVISLYLVTCFTLCIIVVIECTIRRLTMSTYVSIMSVLSILFSFFLGYVLAGEYVDPANTNGRCD